jgi:hypothetical protein
VFFHDIHAHATSDSQIEFFILFGVLWESSIYTISMPRGLEGRALIVWNSLLNYFLLCVTLSHTYLSQDSKFCTRFLQLIHTFLSCDKIYKNPTHSQPQAFIKNLNPSRDILMLKVRPLTSFGFFGKLYIYPLEAGTVKYELWVCNSLLGQFLTIHVMPLCLAWKHNNSQQSLPSASGNGFYSTDDPDLHMLFLSVKRGLKPLSTTPGLDSYPLKFIIDFKVYSY